MNSAVPKRGRRMRSHLVTVCDDWLRLCVAPELASIGAKANDGRFDCARAAKKRRKRRKRHYNPRRETMETFPTFFPVTCTVLMRRRCGYDGLPIGRGSRETRP